MKLNKSIILASTAIVAFAMSSHAFAQSTSSQDVEVIVKGKKGVGPINKETGIKTRSVVDQAFISKGTSGQSIAQTLNVVPGYNFTNNDPYGSQGGNLRLRGLDGSRISLTVDGTQLNDAGNYAIYTNQQLDPEVIATASVLTGGTDVDSMTASSTGGTVNLTTRKPADTFGVQYTGSIGSFNYTRNFLMLDTGKVGPWGTSAFVSYSNQNYDTFTREIPDTGKLHKQQLNFRVYQPMFDNGSFMSLAGHFNRNRNRFIFGQPKASFADPTKGEYYNSAGIANINPSNTGNLRGQSKWVVNDHLFFTVDPSYQYVLANGGGTSTANEATGKIGSWTNANFKNRDLNGDGDALDTVTIYNPNTTQTDRFSLFTSAVYSFSNGDIVRAGASFDRGRTRQTGDGTLVAANGAAIDPFGAKLKDNLALLGTDGAAYERRDRFSKADVDVYFAEYRGHFFDDALGVQIGVKSQKMTRDLNQHCYSSTKGTGSSAPFCTTQAPTTTNANGTVTFVGNSDTFFKPYHTTVDFSKVLPNLGLTWKLADNSQIYGNYAESMSSPRTDNYYAVTLSDTGTIAPANPLPETAKTMELGYRFNTPTIQASADVWSAKYDNRIVSSYDVQTDTYFDRNVGKVDFQGFEGAASWAPTADFNVYANATYTKTEVKNDVPNGKVGGVVVYIPLSGKSLVEVPKWMGNLGASYHFSDFTFNLSGKYVGERFSTDMNDDKTKAYTTVDGSIRWDLPGVPFTKTGTYFQLNVINITNAYYFGSISSQTATIADASRNIAKGTPNFNIGAPRTVILALHTQF